jgi:hypothetical protein
MVFKHLATHTPDELIDLVGWLANIKHSNAEKLFCLNASSIELRTTQLGGGARSADPRRSEVTQH